MVAVLAQICTFPLVFYFTTVRVIHRVMGALVRYELRQPPARNMPVRLILDAAALLEMREEIAAHTGDSGAEGDLTAAQQHLQRLAERDTLVAEIADYVITHCPDKPTLRQVIRRLESAVVRN